MEVGEGMIDRFKKMNLDMPFDTGITSITVGGFKSIRDEQHIDVRPLTLLAGANSSGKSSIMQPLLLIKQTLEATYDPGALLLNGPNAKFTSAEQVLSRTYSNNPNEFHVGIDIPVNNNIMMYYAKQNHRGFTISKMIVSDSIRKEFSLKMTDAQIRQLLPEGLDHSTQSLIWQTKRERAFIHIELVHIDSKNQQPLYLSEHVQSLPFEMLIKDIIHVPGLRGNPERAYMVTGIGDIFPGTFEHYVASVIAHWQDEGETAKLAALSSDLGQLGLTSTVIANRLDDTSVQLQVSRIEPTQQNGAVDLVDISDVGFGVSQTLPVLVALHVARPGQLVYIEQPEIHLHPRAQVAMARVLADAAKRGVRVVAETHSDLILLSVQTLVAEGYLPSELVKLHWFQRGEDGATQITSADIDETGAYGDWPEDFGRVALEAQSRYLDAAELRLRV